VSVAILRQEFAAPRLPSAHDGCVPHQVAGLRQEGREDGDEGEEGRPVPWRLQEGAPGAEEAAGAQAGGVALAAGRRRDGATESSRCREGSPGALRVLALLSAWGR